MCIRLNENIRLVKQPGLFLLTILVFVACKKQTNKQLLPQPTDKTYVKTDMEDGTHRDLKKTWFEDIHQCDPNTDWRLIEHQNALAKYSINSKQSSSAQSNQKSRVHIGSGEILGEWKEKGSINQAGSILKTAYNKVNDRLYAISDGGSMWKGNLTTFTWEVEEQNLRFDGRFLDIVYPSNTSYRIISSLGGHPYYKDSNTTSWQKANGGIDGVISKTKDQVILNDGQHILYLSQSGTNEFVTLYVSRDFGLSYVKLKSFNARDLDKIALATADNSGYAYVIERENSQRSRIYRYNTSMSLLTEITTQTQVQFGSKTVVNLEVIKINSTHRLYSYDVDNKLYKSVDEGRSWSYLGKLPTTPWVAGIHVSEHNPNIMVMGAVEAYRSTNGGRTWTKANEWYDYYENKSTALHADIMHMEEFHRTNGEHNFIISNHGGVSKSTDLGEDYLNIGLRGLNASQYYSVRTYPHDNNYIIAGSQDQGLQRAFDFDEGPATFSQFISGDYGHLQFTNYGKSLWAIYPGGWISYYPDPINAGLAAEFELLTNNRSVWLPPIITSPYNPNSILVAGGSLMGTTGSHIVELTVDDLSQLFGNQWPYNFETGGGEVSAMAYNKAKTDEFFVLTTNGKFFKSTDRGLSFEEKKRGLAEAHQLYGNTILTSSIDPDKVVIAGSGYDNAAVYASYDGGESFTPMVDGLPLTSVFEMVYSPDEKFIFAASEAGPYVYIVDEGLWYDLAQGQAPNQRYWSVEFLEEKQKVRYATYGRGIWDLELERLTSIAETENIEEITVFPNPSTGVFNVKPVDKNGSLRVTDNTGKLIFIKQLESGQGFDFDLSAFPNGLYYIIFDDTSTRSSSVIVKI